jgi:hypothetical protein
MVCADRLDALTETAIGDSVTADALQRAINERPLHQFLEESEQPHFLLQGSMLDIVDESVSGSESGRRSRKVASSGTSLSTVVTDQRLLILIPRTAETERLVVPLAQIRAADSENAPGGNHRLSARAADRSYRIDTSQTGSDETESASEYLASAGSPRHGAETGASGAADGAIASLDALERLADLYDRGMLTEQEFEEMKTKLLEYTGRQSP